MHSNAVLSWDEGSKQILYPIGEFIIDDLPKTEKNHADRSASLWMEENGFKLAISLGNKLAEDPFGVFKNKKQTLFEFHYTEDTFNPGDDRQLLNVGEIEPMP